MRERYPCRTRTFSLTTAAIFAAACGNEGTHRPVVVRDSAGTTIVTSSEPAWVVDAPSLQLSNEPMLEIGIAQGDSLYELNGVVSARRLSDGRIVIANARSSELRVYDASGIHLRTIGRNGEGPGEFRNLGGVFRLPGDSILTLDRALRRLTVFDTQGNVGRIVPLESPDGTHSPQLTGVFDDGSFLVLATRTLTPEAGVGVHRIPGQVFHYAADGTPGALITPLETQEWAALDGDPGLLLMVRAFPRNGYAVTDGRIVYVGDTDRFEIRAYGADGSLARILRRTDEPVPVTQDLMDAWGKVRIDAAPTEDAKRREREILSAMPFPETLPAFGRMIAGADGSLWIEVQSLPGDTASAYSVFDPAGAWLGDVAVPTGFRPFEVGVDYVLGRQVDDLGVERVRLYALIPMGI